jgi:bisphosphoglycerate-dependent phosphoglycerate mutase
MGHLWGRRAAGGKKSSEFGFGNWFKRIENTAIALETAHCFRTKYYSRLEGKLYKSNQSAENDEPQLRTILRNYLQKPPRSKLEPHRELIRELRRNGRCIAKLPASSTSAWGCMSHSAPFTHS